MDRSDAVNETTVETSMPVGPATSGIAQCRTGRRFRARATIRRLAVYCLRFHPASTVPDVTPGQGSGRATVFDRQLTGGQSQTKGSGARLSPIEGGSPVIPLRQFDVVAGATGASLALRIG